MRSPDAGIVVPFDAHPVMSSRLTFRDVAPAARYDIACRSTKLHVALRDSVLSDRVADVMREMGISPYREWSWIIGRCADIQRNYNALRQAEPILHDGQPAWRKR